MKISRLTLSMFLCWIGNTVLRAGTVVHDPIHTVLNVAQQVYGQVRQEAQHAEDITKYTTMIQKQLQQINQLTNIINQNVEQLRRFGNPDTYVNMLGLDDLFEEVNKMKAGVGRTVIHIKALGGEGSRTPVATPAAVLRTFGNLFIGMPGSSAPWPKYVLLRRSSRALITAHRAPASIDAPRRRSLGASCQCSVGS